MVELVGTCYEDAWRFLIREEEGLSPSGHKKELAAKLIARGIK